MIDAINSQLGTSRPKSGDYSYYEPLTDEEKESLSEKQVEKWEAKAKKGLLYRDNILGNINSQLRSMMYTPVELEDGSKLSLFQIGITTSSSSNYIGKLQIDEVKLQKALETNPEGVTQLFTKTSSMAGGTVEARNKRLTDEGIGDRIDDIISNAISTGGSIYKYAGIEGTASVVNNEMYKQLVDQEKKISEMVKTLYKRENYYYSLFSRMESSMMQSNNQMSSLLGALGQTGA
jgi:flagellar hook-associated protein 2